MVERTPHTILTIAVPPQLIEITVSGFAEPVSILRHLEQSNGSDQSPSRVANTAAVACLP
jgi:hypothetical protein